MPTRAVIKLVSTNLESLQSVVDDLLEIAKKTGVRVKGPIPLPRRRIVVATRKTPCGEGSKTWDKWELRIYKRLIQMDLNDRALRSIMRLRMPEDVEIELRLI